MDRVRLTQRDKRAADMSIPYPGNVNQPDRKDPGWEDYHTFQQRVNHELPDMRHDWKDDERDDIGFGVSEPWGESPKVPTVASVRMAANKAVRVAVLLLGEKVEDEVIEAQARDFMSMSQSGMDRTLARFADTQKLYAEDDEDADEKKATDDADKDEKKAAKKDDDEKKAEDKDEKDEKKAEDKADEKKAEDKADEKSDKKAADDKKEPPAFIQKKIDEKEEKKASKELAEGKKAEDKDDKEEKKAGEAEFTPKVEKPGAEKQAEDKKDDEKKAEDKDDEKVEKKASTDMDIELTGAMDEEEEEVDPETAAQLASLFEGKDGSTAAEDLERKPEASKKAGITKLGGQPRVASTAGAGVTDISSIWETAPDVAEVFK